LDFNFIIFFKKNEIEKCCYIITTMTNAIMNNTSQFKDLNEFLANHSAKNNENNKPGDSSALTHTRIGDKELNIYAGSYIIPQDDRDIFYKLYYESVFEKKANQERSNGG
jgi:hypothetical protein